MSHISSTHPTQGTVESLVDALALPECWQAALLEGREQIVVGSSESRRTALLLHLLARADVVVPDFEQLERMATIVCDEPAHWEVLRASAALLQEIEYSARITPVAVSLSQRYKRLPHLEIAAVDYYSNSSRYLWGFEAHQCVALEKITYDVLKRWLPDLSTVTAHDSRLQDVPVDLKQPQFLAFWSQNREKVLIDAMEVMRSFPNCVDKISVGLLQSIVLFTISRLMSESPGSVVGDLDTAEVGLQKSLYLKDPRAPIYYFTPKDLSRPSPASKKSVYESYDLAKASISAERIATEFIRSEVIPAAVKAKISMGDVYYAIHAARFSKDARASHNFGEHCFVEATDVTKYRNSDLYVTQVGKPRTREVVREHSFMHVPHKHVSELSHLFFAALDSALNDFNGSLAIEAAIEILTAAQCFLSIVHIPFDGAGRTNEDFLVYLAARCGHTFTVSDSGYRHFVSEDVRAFSTTEEAFQHQVDTMTFDALNIPLGPSDRDTWAIYSSAAAEQVICGGSRAVQVLKSAYAALFIEHIYQIRPSSQPQFRHLTLYQELRRCIGSGFNRTFSITSPQEAAYLDHLIAFSTVHSPFQVRSRLSCERPDFPHTPLVSRVRSQFMDESASRRFCSPRLAHHYNSLLGDIKRNDALRASESYVDAQLVPFLLTRAPYIYALRDYEGPPVSAKT